MRKTAIPLLIVFSLFTLALQAQQTTVVTQNPGEDEDVHLKIGALAGLTLAMNTADYQVSQVSRYLAPGSHFGVRASIPIGRKTRIVAGVGYHTLAFKDENERISFNDNIDNHSIAIGGESGTGALVTTGTFQYAVLTANLQFSQFFIGVNIGLPMSSEMRNELIDTDEVIPAEGIDPDTHWGTGRYTIGRLIREDVTREKDDINTLIELRAGGEFPIIKSPVGDLNFGISLGWTFNQILKQTKDLAEGTESANFLPNYDDQFYLPNVQFHVSYLFNL